MPWWTWFLVGIAVLAVVYAAFVVSLILAGRRGEARTLATFIPVCIVLVSRLARDPRVPRRRKPILVALLGYLVLRFDLPIAASVGVPSAESFPPRALRLWVWTMESTHPSALLAASLWSLRR